MPTHFLPKPQLPRTGLHRVDTKRDVLVQLHFHRRRTVHDILAADRPGERFVLHLLFDRGKIDIVNAFRWPNERDGDDETVQFIHGEKRCRSAKDQATLWAKFWRRCFSVTERSGYAPSSRLASRPPELSALIPYL